MVGFRGNKQQGICWSSKKLFTAYDNYLSQSKQFSLSFGCDQEMYQKGHRNHIEIELLYIIDSVFPSIVMFLNKHSNLIIFYYEL
jgi:hypothetical protein